MKFYDIEGIMERHPQAVKILIVSLCVLGGVFALIGLILCILSNFIGILLIFLGLAFFSGSGFLYYYAKTFNHNKEKINLILEKLKQSQCITIKELSEKTGLAESKTRGFIDLAYRQGLLNDYIRVGEFVKSKSYVADEKEKKNSVAIECPYCGATFFANKNSTCTCPYCSNALNA